MDHEQLTQKIRELIQPLLSSRQAELVELICRPAGGRLMLRCLVDTARGVTVGELNDLNRAIGAVLDEHDTVPEAYVLEVSSPGLDRPLRGAKDFERVIGRRIKVRTLVPVQARQELSGELVSAGEEFIFLKLDTGDKVRIELSDIAHAVQETKI